MTDTVKHMWDEVEKARADGTFSSEHAAVPAQGENACPWCGFSNGHHPWCRSPAQPASPHNTVLQPPAPHTPAGGELPPASALPIGDLVERLEAMERGESVHIPLAKVIGEIKRLRAQVEEKNLHLSYCREAMRFADIDLSMILPDVANLEVRRSIRKTLDRIDEARKLSHSSTVRAQE